MCEGAITDLPSCWSFCGSGLARKVLPIALTDLDLAFLENLDRPDATILRDEHDVVGLEGGRLRELARGHRAQVRKPFPRSVNSLEGALHHGHRGGILVAGQILG